MYQTEVEMLGIKTLMNESINSGREIRVVREGARRVEARRLECVSVIDAPSSSRTIDLWPSFGGKTMRAFARVCKILRAPEGVYFFFLFLFFLSVVLVVIDETQTHKKQQTSTLAVRNILGDWSSELRPTFIHFRVKLGITPLNLNIYV